MPWATLPSITTDDGLPHTIFDATQVQVPVVEHAGASGASYQHCSGKTTAYCFDEHVNGQASRSLHCFQRGTREISNDAKALQRSMILMERYRINPVHDLVAMMWVEGQGHSIANAKLVASKLDITDKSIMARELSFEKLLGP